MDSANVKKTPYVLGAIVLISIAIKLTLFAMFYHGDIHQITQPDSHSYFYPAKTLLAFGHYFSAPHVPMFIRTPGYPTFIAALFGLFGQQVSVVIIAQILLSGLLVCEAFFIARRLFSLNAAYISAVIVACDVMIFVFNLMVLSETLFVVLIGAVFLIGTYLFTSYPKTLLLTLLLGFFLALATLTRPISYYLIIPIMVGTLWHYLRRRMAWKKIVVGLLLLMLPMLLLVGGWQVRNKLVIGSYAFSAIAAHVLFRHYASVVVQQQQHVSFDQGLSMLQARRDKDGALPQAKKNHLNAKMALSILLSHPKDLFAQMLYGFPRLMLGVGTPWMQFFDPRFNLNKLMRQKSQFFHLHINKLVSENNVGSLGLLFLSVVVFAYTILMYVFMLMGFLMRTNMKWSRNAVAHIFLLGCLLYFILVSSNMMSYARYRMPMQMLLEVYASYGLSCFVLALKQKVFGRRPLSQYAADSSS